jgi:hypothetical protein
MITEKLENCCNCVSFVYYTVNKINKHDKHKIQSEYDKLLVQTLGYLYSLKLSIINIDKYLKNFIARIYLDISLFRTINEIQQLNDEILNINLVKIKECIKFLFEAENTEIYTYLCNSYKNNFEQLRSQRFLPFIDPEVACCIIREADGYVSQLDCFNIQNFVNSKKILFAYNFFINNKNALDITFLNNIDNYIQNFKEGDYILREKYYHKSSYSIGLSDYRFISENNKIGDNFFSNKVLLFDLLAGCIGINIKIKSDKFYEVFNKIVTYNNLHNNSTNDTQFDEIFLMNLLRDLYSISCNHNIDLLITSEKDNIVLNELKQTKYILSNIFTVKQIYNFEYTQQTNKLLFRINNQWENFDFLKDELNINSDKYLELFEHIYINKKIYEKFSRTNIEDMKNIKKYIKTPLEDQEIPIRILRLLIVILDLSIDFDHFKNFDHGIDFNIFVDGFYYVSVILSTQLNYMFTKFLLYELYFDIYEGKYGNFYDLIKRQDLKKKYLKYKQKYLELKKNIFIE